MLILKCKCGAKATVRGNVEYDTNAVNILDDPQWEGGEANCNHEDYEVDGEEYSYDPTDVI